MKLGGTSAAVIAAMFSALFVGLNAVASKLLFAPASPAHFDAMSLFVARGFWTLPLFLILLIATRPKPMPHFSANNIWLLLISGLCYGLGTNALFSLGANMTSASHAVLLLSLLPPVASLLATLLLGEMLSPQKILAIVLGVVGACILTLSKGAVGSTLSGDLLIAAFILTWAALTVCIRRLDVTCSPLFVVGIYGTVGSLLLVLTGLAVGRTDAIRIPLQHFDLTTVLWFDLELVVLLSLAAQVLMSLSLRTLSVSIAVAIVSYGSIAAGIVASVLLLGEHLTTGEVIAGIFLSVALAFSLVPESASAHSRPAFQKKPMK
jgi:drug/metabolite transporter (DMT)-like permease